MDNITEYTTILEEEPSLTELLEELKGGEGKYMYIIKF